MAAAKKTASKRAMSDQHKAALAVGREEGRAVRDYLSALESNRPKRGRKRTPESISRRLEAIEEALDTLDAGKRLDLVQERLDLQAELASMGGGPDLDGLRKAFVAVAKSYSSRKGISYAAWREVGVPVDVLKEAGITRGA